MNNSDINEAIILGNIVFYGTPAYGHINPTLPIITGLVKRGYSVIYYATDEFRQVIEDCGAEFRAYDFGDTEWNPQVGSRILDLTELILKFTDMQLEALLTEARQRNPVLIMHDTLAFWGRAVAGTMGIKAVSVNTIVTVYGYTGRAFRMYMNRFAAKSVLEYKAIPGIMKYKRSLKKRYPIKNMSLLGMLMNEEAFNIFTYPRQVHPEGNKLKENCFFLGPAAILRKNTDDTDEDYRHSNLIYVSLGTIFNDSLDFYRAVLSVFTDTKYTVVIACGKQYEKLMAEKIPTNIILKTYVNQQRIMKNAILFITAGGMNSICEAAANGVPCLLYPQQGEQDINAKAFEKLGLGNIVKSEQKLLEASEKLLNHFQPNPELIREFSTIRMAELMDRLEKEIKNRDKKEICKIKYIG